MAKYRPRVPPKIKLALLQQTSNQCANPGCSNRLLEIHHIKEWAVYQTHDEESMIAICATCHDHVDRGSLTISDEELYRWKGIKRSQSVLTGHLFIEPKLIPRVVLGSTEFAGPDGVTIIDFDRTKLSLAVRDQELGILNLKTVDSSGAPLLDVVDNYVRQRNPNVTINSRPGRYQVTSTNITNAYPSWALQCLSRVPPPRNSPEHFGILDIEVLEPGIVRIRGALLGDNGGIVADNDEALLLSRPKGIAIGLISDPGSRATLFFANAIDRAALDQILPSGFW